MALSVVLFVPDGIVMASDGRMEIRNHTDDQVFIQKKQRTIFDSPLGYMVCVPHPIYVKSLPMSYYYETAIHRITDSQSTYVFAVNLIKSLNDKGVPVENILFYVSGYTVDLKQEVYLVDKNNITKVNKGADNNDVYNFHAIGHNTWLDKLLLPTLCRLDTGESINFNPVNIDFSKYSLEDAVDFACFAIDVSRKMDYFSQVNQRIGELVTIGTQKINGTVDIRVLTQI